MSVNHPNEFVPVIMHQILEVMFDRESIVSGIGGRCPESTMTFLPRKKLWKN